MISEVLIVLLIGEYTEFPAWLPADPGSGIALFNSTEGAEPLANTVLPYIIRLFFAQTDTVDFMLWTRVLRGY